MGNIIDLVNEYPIFKEQKMKLPLQSIVAIDDEHTDDRAFLVDMMDTWSSDDHDTFFNDMLCAINFIRSKEDIEDIRNHRYIDKFSNLICCVLFAKGDDKHFHHCIVRLIGENIICIFFSHIRGFLQVWGKHIKNSNIRSELSYIIKIIN